MIFVCFLFRAGQPEEDYLTSNPTGCNLHFDRGCAPDQCRINAQTIHRRIRISFRVRSWFVESEVLSPPIVGLRNVGMENKNVEAAEKDADLC